MFRRVDITTTKEVPMGLVRCELCWKEDKVHVLCDSIYIDKIIREDLEKPFLCRWHITEDYSYSGRTRYVDTYDPRTMFCREMGCYGTVKDEGDGKYLEINCLCCSDRTCDCEPYPSFYSEYHKRVLDPEELKEIIDVVRGVNDYDHFCGGTDSVIEAFMEECKDKDLLQFIRDAKDFIAASSAPDKTATSS